MNRYIKLALTISLVALIGVLSGCDDDDSSGPAATTEVDRVFGLLSSSGWSVSEVLVDDLDFSSTYSGLSINFQEGTYTSVNGGAIFGASGTWNFTSSSAEQILIDGETEIDILEISENSLVVGLTWNQNTLGTGGRTSSVSGNHVFTFTR
ncbi:MAG: hypothetical protein RLO81_08765 [Fulvivirga sp.]|uniref:hypothetical protein n=1 Tax=Fulvivirga sp. TaxID=1931237 RepID=UPI0032F03E0C